MDDENQSPLRKSSDKQKPSVRKSFLEDDISEEEGQAKSLVEEAIEANQAYGSGLKLLV
jgi:hypothetical protein